MLYYILRSLVRISLHFYCKRIGWEGAGNIPKNKPVLFAVTHSNSFLDALFLAASLKQSVYCLARGDAFRKPIANRILRHFCVLPIFRQSDKEQNAVVKNEKTFAECQQLFLQNQWVLIFPEGNSVHQTTVSPLKKGVSVMAQRAWAAGIDVQVIPVSITYDSFMRWGEKCDVIFQKPIQNIDIHQDMIENQTIQLNKKLHSTLSANFPSPFQFQGKTTLWGRFGQLLYYLGWVIHFPLYFLCQYLGKCLAKKTVFYDSIIVGLLSVLLPFYYLIVSLMFYFISMKF